jgi:chemotaxis protein MotA
MDLGSVIGLVLIILGVFVGAVMKHVSPGFLVSIPAALLIVIVASIGATLLSFTFKDSTNVIKAILKSILPGPPVDKAAAIKGMVEMAGKSRRDGILSLESELQKVEDRFLRKGLQMAIDGVDPESVQEVLKTDIKAMKLRHKVGADWCTTMGVFAPTFGIIGAVFGLIATMKYLDSQAELAKGIQAAFVATFWGVFWANGLFLPFGNKLKRLSAEEVEYREMIREGVMMIQSGTNPRVVEETLLGYLPPSEQEGFTTGSGA